SRVASQCRHFLNFPFFFQFLKQEFKSIARFFLKVIDQKSLFWLI
ncbi:MAG: hypothetical protein ACI9S6_001027, partial [Reinekea sp.]